MRKSLRILGAACVCLLAASLVAGCAKKAAVIVPPPQASSDSTSGSVTSTPSPLADEGTGPITSPASGSVIRTDLMDAARAKLNTTSQFVVYQLYVQGDYAIGDLEAETGGQRQFVAFKGPDWKALWVAPFGSASADSASVKGAEPGLSDALIAKIDWKYQKPASSAAMIASLGTAAKSWSKTLMEGLGQPYKVTLAKVAQDGNGEWWGRAIVQPSSSATGSFEAIEFWCRYSVGAWAGAAQDPEPPAPTSYFPASVVGALGF